MRASGITRPLSIPSRMVPNPPAYQPLFWGYIQTPIAMWLSARLTRAEFAFFTRFGTTSGTADPQTSLSLSFHLEI